VRWKETQVATKVLVSVINSDDLDGADRLRTELELTTGWAWDLSEVDGPASLSGVVEILLTAVITTGTEIFMRAGVDKVKDVVHDWRKERLDPPRTEVRSESVAGEDAAEDDAGTKPSITGDDD
jgi:hypothetical protein